MMTKASKSGLLSLSRRPYGAPSTAEGIVTAVAASAVGTKLIPAQRVDDDEKKVYWMKDPKTGNWVPESHFGVVDVAELREKFLGQNKGKTMEG